MQSEGHSPKRLNGMTSAQQLKSSPEFLQNNGTAVSSQIKGKKRRRGDQGMQSIKRDCILKADDGDSAVCKFDNIMIRAEISKITEKGALVTTEGVEKLLQLMQVGYNGQLHLTGRVLLADVIAATDRIDCLNKFVQNRGLLVLDEWIQKAHKGKTGDGSSLKETDKAIEDLVLSLLRALDKLPVNLNALQTCNIGKSVNHLRGSKNLEIQKKARSLVDTWKKRVDADMKTIDTKTVGSSQPVTWSMKPWFNEISHVGNGQTGLADLSMKNSITQQSTCKVLPGKHVSADGAIRLNTLIAGSPKLQSSSLAPAAIASSAVIGAGDLDLSRVVAKEEKSNSLTQFQNISLFCSNDHAKTIKASLKEDDRSSTARSVNACKTSVGSSHSRWSSNGYMASSNSRGQKDSNKLDSVGKNSVVDKVSQSLLSCAKIIGMPVSDNGRHKFIARQPNENRSPARSISGNSLEDPSAGSRASSPVVPDKHEHGDPKGKTRNGSGQSDISANLNAESWQSNDVKEGFVGCDEGDGSPAVIPEEEVRDSIEVGNVAEISRTACLSDMDRGAAFTNPKRMNSFSSMNALVESCANCSGASTPLPDGDDVGMNLLASVATGEMCGSDLVSSTAFPRSSPVKENHCAGSNEPKVRFSSGGSGCQILSSSADNTTFISHKDRSKCGSAFANGQIRDPKFTCIREELNRKDVDQNKDVKGVVSNDFCVDFEERSPVGETKSSALVCEKNAEQNLHTSDSDEKLLSHCVGGSSLRQRSLDKIEHRPATCIGEQIPISDVATEAVENDCQDASDRNASAEKHTGSFSSSHIMATGAETIERKGSIGSCSAGSSSNDELPTIPREADTTSSKEELVSVEEATSFITIAEQDAWAKLYFDLNEGVPSKDMIQSEPVTTVAPGSTATRMASLPPFKSYLVFTSSPAPITTTPAKGPFRA